MAYGFNLKCKDCDYHIRAFIGRGLRYSPQNIYYGPRERSDRSKGQGYLQVEGKTDSRVFQSDQPALFALVNDKEISEFAQVLLDRGSKPTGRYGQSLYTCPKCHRLFNRFHFQLRSGNALYEPDYWCPDCDGVLEQVDFDYNAHEVQLVGMTDRVQHQWRCPECGSSTLIQDGSRFLWG